MTWQLGANALVSGCLNQEEEEGEGLTPQQTTDDGSKMKNKIGEWGGEKHKKLGSILFEIGNRNEEV